MQYEVTLYPERVEPYYSEYYAGLYELQAAGVVTLRFTARRAFESRSVNGMSPVWMEIRRLSDGATRRIAIDPCDWQEIASTECLRNADIYFKRSYKKSFIDQLDGESRRKVLPISMSYTCRSPNESAYMRFRQMLAHHILHKTYRSHPLKMMAQILGQPAKLFAARLKLTRAQMRLTLQIEDFECPPDVPAAPHVMYRTRVYSPDKAKDSFRAGLLEHLNEMRVGVVRALKERFGPRYVGGIAQSAFVEKNYPDCALPDYDDMKGHIAKAKSSLINVTTDGLHDSTSWKFVEYMAASRCIVAERPKYEPPVAPNEGTHYLGFESPDQCVQACEQILTDPELASSMRAANFRFYNEHLRPDRVMLSALETAFAHAA